jgi:hypothetical protein
VALRNRGRKGYSYHLISQSFESFSEDPYLSGMLAAAYVKGLQTGGIGAAIKHFVSGIYLFFKVVHELTRMNLIDATTRKMTDLDMIVFSANVLSAKSTCCRSC